MSDTHQMQMAKVSPQYARAHNLNANHHARVWCSCMDDPVFPPGNFSERPRSAVLSDPRRLGAYDHLGVVDLRVPNSALNLWKEHADG